MTKAQCVAGFTSNVNSVNGQYGTGLVTFTDTSHASVGDTLISWAWDFGDGVTANIKNPIHYYPTPGNYTVTLLVNDNTSNDVTQQQFLMNVAYPHGCQAYNNFNYPQPYPAVPGPPVPISFDGNLNVLPTNDGIASVLWDFGDGTTSTLFNPVHTYVYDTAYVVNYTITTNNGCTSTHGVIVNAAPCTMFSTVTVSATDSTIFDLQFFNGVPPYTPIWEQSTVLGVYDTVPSSQLSNNNFTLQALDSTVYLYGQSYAANGCKSSFSPFSLNGFNFNYSAYNQTINTNYVFLQQSGNGLTVDFADNSQYTYYTGTPINIVSHFWDFGDGSTSTQAFPTHVYAGYGSYAITHTVTDNQGLVGTITSNINVSLCNYNFISSITPPSANNNILFANVTGGFPPFNYTWNDTLNGANPTTTNSIIANRPGWYLVHVTDANGCVASISQWATQDAYIQYNPHFQDTCSANFAYGLGTSSIIPNTAALSIYCDEMTWGYLANPHTYTWTYSDGYVDTIYVNYYDSLTPFATRPYAPGEVFDVTLTVTGGGCNASTTQTIDFSAGACNLSPNWPWSTSDGLFQGQYPLKITANAANGAGTQASRTYLWSNGSTAPFIYAYTSGEYCVTITDSLGCSKSNCYTYYAPYDSTITLCGNIFNDANNNGVFDGLETAVVNSNLISVTGNGSTYNATVDGQGHYEVNVPAGNYIISYSTTPGNNFTTPFSSDTIAKYLNVTAGYGNNSCVYNFGISNNTSTISGKLFYDDDNDGVLDSLETGIAYQPIIAGPYTVFTDAHGNFNMNVIANSYSLTYTPQNAFSSYTLTTPGTISINANTVGSNFPNKNFGIHTTNIGADLGVNLWPTSVVNNGFPAHYTIEYYNNGATSANNTITLTYDSLRTFDNASITPTNINTATRTITWDIPTIAAYTNQYLYVNFTAIVQLMMNTPVTTTAAISNNTGIETLLANNTATLNQLSVSSWDPNDKLVIRTNSGNVMEQYISSINTNQTIEYMIRFQNLGNYKAINIRIVDELSDKLDPNSYVLLGGSDNCQVTRLGNIVTYKFDNIDLPTEADSGDASNGFVTFKIKALSSLVEGDIISDMANIYFDFNEPVATPYSNLLMVDPSFILDSQAIIITNNNVGVFPNPLSGRGFVKYVLTDDSQVKLSLSEINGKTIMDETTQGNKGMNYYNLDVSNHKSGLYILKVSSSQGTSNHKINIINK
jgi:PKD repeat protein